MNTETPNLERLLDSLQHYRSCHDGPGAHRVGTPTMDETIEAIRDLINTRARVEELAAIVGATPYSALVGKEVAGKKITNWGEAVAVVNAALQPNTTEETGG